MKILIAEDDPVSRRLLEAKLVKWGFDVIATCNGNEAWEILRGENAPRLAILDWMMPGLDGVDLCRRLRQGPAEPYTYIILLTSLQRDEDIVAGLEAGADDYVTKPFKASELNVRLRAGRRIVELQSQLIAAREAQREKATHDPLTGLWNHEEILNILGRELNRADRNGGNLSLIIADLDHFKKVNDRFGHLAGDAVLRHTTSIMLSLVRDYDSIGRYGGEEFLIVLPDCNAKQAATIAERIRWGIAQDNIETAEGRIPVTISLGLAHRDKGEGGDVNSLVRAADQALYQAKAKGRNRVEAASEADIEL